MALSKSLSTVLKSTIYHRLHVSPLSVSYSFREGRSGNGSKSDCITLTSNSASFIRCFSSSGVLRSSLLPKPSFTFDTKSSEIPVVEQASEGITEAAKDTAFNLGDKEVIDLSQFLVTTETKAALVDGLAQITQSASGILTATDLNLTWWLPPNFVFKTLTTFHEYLPWWGSIMVLTMIMRILVFPLVVKTQRNSAQMSEIAPQMAEAQHRMSEARRSGNQIELQKASFHLQATMAKTQSSMLKNLWIPLVQTPIFLSVFFALREMSDYPIASMKTGGLFWFTDLTTKDPYYLLPLLTGTTLHIMFKYGVDMGINPNPTVQKFLVYVLPLGTMAFIYSFNSALLVYWCTTNLFSLIQVYVIRQKRVREFLNIPQMKKWDPSDMPPKKGMKDAFGDTMDNWKLNRRINARRRDHEQDYQRAGIGPLQKTYKTDPTKQLE